MFQKDGNQIQLCETSKAGGPGGVRRGHNEGMSKSEERSCESSDL